MFRRCETADGRVPQRTGWLVPRHEGPFSLVRFYLLTAAMVVTLSSLALWAYRSLDVRQLIDLSQTHNASLAQPVATAIWSRFADFFAGASHLNPAALEARPEIEEIAAAVNEIVSGLGIIKVKIYNLDGVTVFSTNPVEIGEHQGHNPGFTEAVQLQRSVSELTKKGTENSFERKITDIDVVETYMPVKSPEGDVAGVFEIYRDVSPLLATIERSAAYLQIGFLTFCILVYGTIFMVVHRADRIIQTQYADISNKNAVLEHSIAVRQAAERALQRARDELEEQVKARTHQLSEQIKARKRIEDEAHRRGEELARAGAVITVGEMATTLAHELNQPLTVITGCAQLALSKTHVNNEGQALRGLEPVLDQIAEQADRANQIVARVRGFVGKRAAVRELTMVSTLIEDLSDLLRAVCREQDVTICFDLATDLPPIMVDPVQIQQVVLNLVQNAVEAMKSVPPAERRILIETNHARGGSIQVTIQDTGPGVPHEVRDAVFHPFYTTKPSGLGLGLSISHSIVESHGGHLDTVTGGLGGAAFRFILPAACADRTAVANV